MSEDKNVAVLTSGGDAPGMNACVRAVVRSGVDKGFKLFGVYRGYEGLLDGDIKKLTRRSVGDIMQRGGTILRTARSARFQTKEGLDQAAKVLKERDIDTLIVVGGNGSFAGALELSARGINVIGIPASIDNDLGYTDFTIGFDTAVTTVLDGISKLRDTSSAHDRVFVIEVMGRECGDIALYSGLTGGAESVMIPEVECDPKEIAEKTLSGIKKGRLHSIIIRAEGASVSAEEMVKVLEETTGKDTKLVTLSYLQRGGPPTMRDRLLATLMGSKAIDAIAEGLTVQAVGLKGGEIELSDLDKALKVEKKVKMDMYDLIGVLSK